MAGDRPISRGVPNGAAEGITPAVTVSAEELSSFKRNRVSILGVTVDAIAMSDLTDAVAMSVGSGTRTIVANHNLHSVYLAHHNAEMREFYSIADLIHVDGMGVVLASRLLSRSLPHSCRVTYVDWMGPLMARAASCRWRVFFLGSRPGVADIGAEILSLRHAGLDIQAHHGFFDASRDSAENRELIQRIHAYDPQILMVGMGMPRQERWVLENAQALPNCVILMAGAAMDYVAGVVPTPPRLFGRLGFEWLFRLVAEPSRLWKRYLIEPWFIARLILLARFGR